MHHRGVFFLHCKWTTFFYCRFFGITHTYVTPFGNRRLAQDAYSLIVHLLYFFVAGLFDLSTLSTYLLTFIHHLPHPQPPEHQTLQLRPVHPHLHFVEIIWRATADTRETETLEQAHTGGVVCCDFYTEVGEGG